MKREIRSKYTKEERRWKEGILEKVRSQFIK
jgi:hypothetical protein